jgi:hypothetical protein
VRRRGATGKDQRIVFPAGARAERDLREVEDREHVRIRELELEREPDDVEVAKGPRALEREDR